MEPEALDGIELGGARRQRDERHAGRRPELVGTVPTGSIEDDDGMLVGSYRLGEFVEVDLHGVRRDFGQDERKAVVRAGLDRAEDVGEGVALIATPRRSLSLRVPAMADAPFLADACFVLEKQAKLLFRACITNRFQVITELF